MFVGRLDEVLAFEQALAQTRAGRLKHFMVTGERGVGKTSLLNYTRCLAHGAITLEATSFQFFVVDVDVERGTTPLSLGRKIERALDETSEPRAFKVMHSAVSPNGRIAATYVRAGEVKTATIGGAQEPTPAELARREKLKREG